MSLPSPKALAINAGILVFLGVGGVVFVQHLLFKPGQTVCSERYSRMMAMTIKRDGTLMTPSDVQANAAGRDLMVMENLRFSPFTGAPQPAGLTVALKAGTSQPDNERAQPGGISFPWLPRALPKGLTSGCLTYNVYLPADFNFDTAGTLPGLFGTSAKLGAATGERFTTHVTWQRNGEFGTIVSLMAKAGILTETSNHDRRAPLPRGRWFKIDQEVKLNSREAPDGFVRLWIDGALRSQLPNAHLRENIDTFIDGVAVDTFFGGVTHDGQRAEGKAQKDETIRFTPFEIRWN